MGSVNGREDESIPAAADASAVKPVARAAHAPNSRSAVRTFSSDLMTNSLPHSPHVPNRSCKDHSILIVVPQDMYHYRFVVDAEERYIPDLPNVADEMGQSCKWTGVLRFPYFLVFLLSLLGGSSIYWFNESSFGSFNFGLLCGCRSDGGTNFLKIWLIIIVSVGAHKVFGLNPL
ncbi:hypothetical protein VNO78_03098 [Psophocarpus tetragonolobus]|uniref:AMP-activated protein kinase glycogen-binding domain-containing protein n=1 Tax=Psophocarpus tetragonolobus TaxID=3891 RepID=A0AAN9XVU0_PSOTE